MNHTKRELWTGTGVIALGLVLCLCGNSFSSQWQSLNDGTWAGATDSASGLSWRTLGNMTLLVGCLILAHTAWIWINAREKEALDLRLP
jgi:hypothetical protein